MVSRISLEDDDTSNLPEFNPINSNQHVKKAIQKSAITKADTSVNVSLKTLIEQQAARDIKFCVFDSKDNIIRMRVIIITAYS